jgi:hypothetical protein
VDTYEALEHVAKARARVDDAVEARDRAIAEARLSDCSLRQIAEAAGMNHEKVRTILTNLGVARI